MDGRDLFRRLVARWRLVLVGFVLAVLVGGVGYLLTPAAYTSQAGVLVMPPTTESGSAVPINPLSALDSGVTQVANALVYVVSSPQATEQIADASDGGSAVVVDTTSDPTDNTPLIQITGSGASAATANQATQSAIDVMNGQLSKMQTGSGVPKFLLMRLAIVVSPAAVSASGTDRLKAGGLIAGIVFVLGLAFIAIVDRILLSRRVRASAALAPPASGGWLARFTGRLTAEPGTVTHDDTATAELTPVQPPATSRSGKAVRQDKALPHETVTAHDKPAQRGKANR